MFRSLLDKLIIRAHRIRCGIYVGDCGLCREWKAQKAERSPVQPPPEHDTGEAE